MSCFLLLYLGCMSESVLWFNTYVDFVSPKDPFQVFRFLLMHGKVTLPLDSIVTGRFLFSHRKPACLSYRESFRKV